VNIEDKKHPTSSFLENPWKRRDEWYDYRSNPRSLVHVIMSLDPKSYAGSTMLDDHPITWCHEFEGGRAWYTGMGHTNESFTEAPFVKMLSAAIRWAGKQ
jgi:type 1 glutamine amidotransferase